MSRNATIYLIKYRTKENRLNIIAEQICKLIYDKNKLDRLEEVCGWSVKNEETFIGEMYGSELKEIIPQDDLDIEVLNNDEIRIEIM